MRLRPYHGSQENEDGDDAERDEDVGDVVVGHFANRTRARRLLGADVGAQVFGRRCHRYAVRFVGDSHGCLLLRLGPNSDGKGWAMKKKQFKRVHYRAGEAQKNFPLIICIEIR